MVFRGAKSFQDLKILINVLWKCRQIQVLNYSGYNHFRFSFQNSPVLVHFGLTYAHEPTAVEFLNVVLGHLATFSFMANKAYFCKRIVWRESSFRPRISDEWTHSKDREIRSYIMCSKVVLRCGLNVMRYEFANVGWRHEVRFLLV